MSKINVDHNLVKTILMKMMSVCRTLNKQNAFVARKEQFEICSYTFSLQEY